MMMMMRFAPPLRALLQVPDCRKNPSLGTEVTRVATGKKIWHAEKKWYIQGWTIKHLSEKVDCCEIFQRSQGFAKSLVNVPVALQLFKTSPRFGDVTRSVVWNLEIFCIFTRKKPNRHGSRIMTEMLISPSEFQERSYNTRHFFTMKSKFRDASQGSRISGG